METNKQINEIVSESLITHQKLLFDCYDYLTQKIHSKKLKVSFNEGYPYSQILYVYDDNKHILTLSASISFFVIVDIIGGEVHFTDIDFDDVLIKILDVLSINNPIFTKLYRKLKLNRIRNDNN